jgi:hypothetical protein
VGISGNEKKKIGHAPVSLSVLASSPLFSCEKNLFRVNRNIGTLTQRTIAVTEPKTVSNLPLDVSIRWAEDQKILEESKPIIRDSTMASNAASTEVILPANPSELEVLFGLSKLHPAWATFQKPPGFFLLRRRIFRSQLAPFLGSDEQQDSMMTRIQGTKGDDQDQDQWEEEKRRLITMLQLMQLLNKDLIDITTRCKQYQKG